MILPLASLFLNATQTPTWSFVYPDDAKPGSRLDLRSLNEKVAGETGYVRVARDGRGLVRGDGKPIRFWCVNGYGFRLKPEEMARNARFLAKMGVNMVRLHASVSPKGKGKLLTDVDTDEIDRIWRYVAALKKEGVYATISPYWANGGHSGAAASWGLGYGDGEDVWGLLFFDDRLRAAYKGWMRRLYAEKNPYTGVPLAKDPAVALVQVQNEDSLLFWTFQGIKPAQKRALATRFVTWLGKRYGSVEAAKKAWGGAGDWIDGVPAFLDVWVLTQPQTGAAKVRADDQTAFLLDQQRGFYADIAGFFRSDLGYKGLTNASNWVTADPVRMNDLERYTYLPTDVMAVNRYTNGGVHKGPNDGWRIDEGDFLSDASALRDPRGLPTNLKGVVGHPMFVTEGGWVAPLGYQAEGPLLVAAYGSLTGLAGFDWFEMGKVGYDPNPVFDFVAFPDGGHPLSKWEMGVPATLGQFPAAALIARLGYVRRGAPVVHEERTRAQLDAREIPVIAEDPSFDPNHNGGDARAGTSAARIDPRAFLVGPVEVAYDGDPGKTVVKDLAPYLAGGTIRSNTGELSLDPVRGLLRIDAPKAQGVVGFLKGAGPFRLKDLTVTSNDEYATIVVVPLDAAPIATSKRLLVQIGTVARPKGWRQEPATLDGKPGWKVVSTGTMPWQVRETGIALSVRNAVLSKATPLDPAGYPLGSVPVRRAGGRLSVRLPADAMYVILE